MALGKSSRTSTYAGPACPRCDKKLEHEAPSSGAQSCPHCRKPFEGVIFPRVEQAAFVARLDTAGPGDAVPCATHELNAAVASCQRCGAFCCDLCRVDAEGKTYCANCFDRLSAEGALASTRTKFRHYEGMLAVCVIFALLLWPLAALFGLAGLYYAVKGLKQKKAMGEEDGVRLMWIALVLSCLAAASGILLVVWFFVGLAS